LPYFNLLARIFTPYRRIREIERMIEKPVELPGVAIVPLKTTARAQFRLNWASGRVSRRALDQALALVEAVSKDKLVFIACHHPLIEPHKRLSKQTHRGAEALEALVRAGAHAVLTGHVHDAFDVEHRDGEAVVRMIGAGTLSERTRSTPPSFNEIRIENSGFEVVCRTMTPQPDEVLPVEEPVAA